MKRFSALFPALACLALLAGCPAPPTPAPDAAPQPTPAPSPAPAPSSVPDASPADASTTPAPAPTADATGCTAACAALVTLQCPEGQDPSCVATCQHVQTAKLTDIKPACIAASTSLSAVHACGVKCPVAAPAAKKK